MSGWWELAGWLVKDKATGSSRLLGDKTKRWFALTIIDSSAKKGLDQVALCYYKNQGGGEPRGWMFMRDVTGLKELGPKTFLIEHPSRSYVLHAASPFDHKRWMNGLNDCLAALKDLEKARSAPNKAAAPEKLYEYDSVYQKGGGKKAHGDEDDAPIRRRLSKTKANDEEETNFDDLEDELDGILVNNGGGGDDDDDEHKEEPPAKKREAFDYAPPRRDEDRASSSSSRAAKHKTKPPPRPIDYSDLEDRRGDAPAFTRLRASDDRDEDRREAPVRSRKQGDPQTKKNRYYDDDDGDDDDRFDRHEMNGRATYSTYRDDGDDHRRSKKNTDPYRRDDDYYYYDKNPRRREEDDDDDGRRRSRKTTAISRGQKAEREDPRERLRPQVQRTSQSPEPLVDRREQLRTQSHRDFQSPEVEHRRVEKAAPPRAAAAAPPSSHQRNKKKHEEEEEEEEEEEPPPLEMSPPPPLSRSSKGPGTSPMRPSDSPVESAAQRAARLRAEARKHRAHQDRSSLDDDDDREAEEAKESEDRERKKKKKKKKVPPSPMHAPPSPEFDDEIDLGRVDQETALFSKKHHHHHPKKESFRARDDDDDDNSDFEFVASPAMLVNEHTKKKKGEVPPWSAQAPVDDRVDALAKRAIFSTPTHEADDSVVEVAGLDDREPPPLVKKKEAVKIARRGAGGDELEIDWGPSGGGGAAAPKRKGAKSALARRLEEGRRPASSKRASSSAKTKTKRGSDASHAAVAGDPALDLSSDDDDLGLAAEKARIERARAMDQARRDSAQATKEKLRASNKKADAAAAAAAAAATQHPKAATSPKINHKENHLNSTFSTLSSSMNNNNNNGASLTTSQQSGFGHIVADKDFVVDDWDEDNDDADLGPFNKHHAAAASSKGRSSNHRGPSSLGSSSLNTGGVAVDNDFLDDWD